MVARRCDSCKSAAAGLFCRADSAFLCVGCDARVHAANKLACRHGRVSLCEVCEHAPAQVTCKADAAVLCAACDSDVHSANPLARRHERVPVTPFFHPASATVKDFSADADGDGDGEVEVAAWILPDPKPAEAAAAPDLNASTQFGFDVDPYLDLAYGGSGDPKFELHVEEHVPQDRGTAADGVVPVQSSGAAVVSAAVGAVGGVGSPESYFEFDFGGLKPFGYGYSSQSLSHSVSSSSLDVGVVPDASAATAVDLPDPFGRQVNNFSESANPPVQISSADREARVLRYREKRKTRRFEKTIRYASRKAYAESRPRIKGRFAKRTDLDVDALVADPGYGVVPTF